MTTTDAGFLAAICAEPHVHTHKLVYADWLEDHGRGDEAEAWRWLGKQGKMPWYTSSTRFYWWRVKGREDGDDMPDAIFKHLTGWYYQSKGTGFETKIHGTLAEAYLDAVQAFCAAWREGWQPEE